MISGVTVEVAGASHTFRMTTRAMMAIEDHFGAPLMDVMQGFEDGFKVSDLVFILSQCAEDGAGVEIGVTSEVVDQMGVGSAADILGRVSEAAFPEAKASGKGSAKNAKRAARSK